jgi:hypothetical protein
MFKNLSLGVLMIACISEAAIAEAQCVLLPGGSYSCSGDCIILPGGKGYACPGTPTDPNTFKQDTFKQAVEGCVAIVRKETNAKAGGYNVSEFDAYVNSDQTVHYLGTARERFSFEKCMNERGHPLDPIHSGR